MLNIGILIIPLTGILIVIQACPPKVLMALTTASVLLVLTSHNFGRSTPQGIGKSFLSSCLIYGFLVNTNYFLYYMTDTYIEHSAYITHANVAALILTFTPFIRSIFSRLNKNDRAPT